MFISIIKSCINKPIKYFNPVLSLDFGFLVSEAEEENDEIPDKTPRTSGRLTMMARVQWPLQLWMVAN